MSQKLKETIDRMVEDSIRRILPAVMNEVLLKTIANASVIQEKALPLRQQPVAQKASKAPSRRPASLSTLLDPEAGADFYQDPRERAPVREEIQAPPQKTMAQRIQSLPPQFQVLAEGMEIDDDGEMWESELGDSGIASAGRGPSLNEGAQAGLDFSRMRQAIIKTEKKTNPGPDAAAKAQFEEARLKAMRDRLDKMA